jgi:hypothetical protein
MVDVRVRRRPAAVDSSEVNVVERISPQAKPFDIEEAGQSLVIDPGTPDAVVPLKRLRGRVDFRVGMTEPPASIVQNDRVGWWLGWYDERLRRFFGR